jgi:hypothetical protein
MDRTGENDPRPRNEDAPTPRVPLRRDVLQALLGGLGLVAAGGSVLGQSLWVRAAAPQQAAFPGPTTLTTLSQMSYTLAATVPATLVFTKSSSAPPRPGTYTSTVPPYLGGGGTFTGTMPAPGWETQTVTYAYTESFFYTPPATNFRTESWVGTGCTYTSSRSPSFMTITVSFTATASYTTLVEDDDSDNPPGDGDGGGGMARNVDVVAGAPVVVRTIDAPDLDLTQTSGRRSMASLLRFAHGHSS